MIPKIKNFYQKISLDYVRDPKTFGLLIFLVIVLLVTWSGAKAIQTNYGLQKQISQINAEVRVQQLKNNNLQLENEYYNTNQYLELSARQNFGLGAPGETEVIIPSNVASSHIVPLSSESSGTQKPTSEQPVWQHNFEAWVNFFLHRQTSS
jgi:cell division protein FtsB